MANEYTTEQKVMDYQTLFTSEAGVRVLADLDKRCCLKGELFHPVSERETCYSLGAYWVIRYIHSLIEKDTSKPEQETVKNEGVKL
jgi:hypothetical protein